MGEWIRPGRRHPGIAKAPRPFGKGEVGVDEGVRRAVKRQNGLIRQLKNPNVLLAAGSLPFFMRGFGSVGSRKSHLSPLTTASGNNWEISSQHVDVFLR